MEKNVNMLEKLMEVNRFRVEGNYKKALQKVFVIYQMDGENCELCSLIAELYFSLGLNTPQETGENFQLAINWMKKAIEKDTENPNLHTKLGDMYWLGLVDYNSAAEEYYKALEINENHRAAHIHIAALYGAPDSHVTLEEAIIHLTSASKLDPNDPDSLARLGELLMAKGDVEGAHKIWVRALTCTNPLSEGYMKCISEQFAL